MGDVTGATSSLPGSLHALPAGACCDTTCHGDRAAVANIQGETDSFGCETHFMCTECVEEYRAYARSDEARCGRCDWCKHDVTDLRDTRDYEEGMCGPVYRVCGACRTRRDEAAERDLASHDDSYWDYPEVDDFDNDDGAIEDYGWPDDE